MKILSILQDISISAHLYLRIYLLSVALGCLQELQTLHSDIKLKMLKTKTITTIYSSNIHSSVSGSTYCILFNLIICVNENFTKKAKTYLPSKTRVVAGSISPSSLTAAFVMI